VLVLASELGKSADSLMDPFVAVNLLSTWGLRRGSDDWANSICGDYTVDRLLQNVSVGLN
jgi:hypothetical protein